MKQRTLVRKTPLRAKRGHRFPAMVDEGFRQFVRQQPCILAGREGHVCWPPVAACHVIPKARGVPDAANLFPACRIAHAHQEGRTLEFEEKWDVDLYAVAHTLWDVYSDGFDFGGNAA